MHLFKPLGEGDRGPAAGGGGSDRGQPDQAGFDRPLHHLGHVVGKGVFVEMAVSGKELHAAAAHHVPPDTTSAG